MSSKNYLESLDKAQRIKLLARLEILAEEACIEAQDEDIDGAINWGDLHCAGAEICLRSDGSEYINILIEEAAPDAYYLRNFIETYMKSKMLQDEELSLVNLEELHIETEW